MGLTATILLTAGMALATVLGAVLTLITLPGLWFLLTVALVCQWLVDPAPFSWWTLGVGLGLGVVGEVVDIVASAAGAKRAGGGRAGAWSSIAGAIIGAIAGSLIFPIVGSIVGGVLGAGMGAFAGERGIAGKTWSQSAKVGGGAAAGRFVAMVLKTGLTIGAGVMLTVAAAVP